MTQDTAPLSARAAREAARWLARLGSAQATEQDAAACQRWRASDAEHERAWQRAHSLQATFSRIPPALGAQVLKRPALQGRRTALRLLGGLALIPAGLAGWREVQHRGWLADYRTAVGQRAERTLADGTVLVMNTDTRADVWQDASGCHIQLHAGEIHVRAETTQSAQVQVHVPQGVVAAHTPARFTVRRGVLACQAIAHVGSLQLQPTYGRAQRLNPPEQAWFDDRHARVSQTTADVPGWVSGTLRVQDMRLDDFLDELSRYRNGVLRHDPGIAALRLSGTFQLDDLDAALDALPTLLPVQVRRYTDYWVMVGTRHPT